MKKHRGFTLIEIIVATLILSLTALGVFGIFQITLRVLAGDKAREGAVALLNEKMELMRNLAYDDVGTSGGVIAGAIQQNETVIRNGISYNVNTQILYIDDPFDGTEGGSPDDEIATDYKKVKIIVSWQSGPTQKQLATTTYVAPKGLEKIAGGGTLRITTLNGSGLPVPQANVHLINNQIAPPIDDNTLETNNSGILNLPGLPPSQEKYQITVSKAGYNSDYTCAIDPAGAACTANEGNPVPTKAHASVIEGELTEISFNIDLLADLLVRALSQTIPTVWKINTDDTTYNQDNPALAQCPNGHYVFSWRDYRQQNNPRIYAQKYSASQTKQWSQDLAITTSNNQNHPDVVVDATCNSYFAWHDDRNGNQDIYFDKYSPTGSRLWTDSKKVETAANSADQTNPQITINASSTALYLVWQDNRDDAADIYLQKYDLTGNQLWNPEIKVNLGTTGSQQTPALSTVNSDVFVVWQDNRSGDDDIYLQKINAGGSAAWAADKPATIQTSGAQQNPNLIVDTANQYLYVVWQDNRLSNYHIYLQKLDFDGNLIFASDVRVDSAPDSAAAKAPKISVDNSGLLYIVWHDNRNGTNDIYLQKFDASGNKLFSSDVRINSATSGQQENPDILINLNNRPAISWQDDSAGNFDILAAQFLGDLNNPTNFGGVPLTVTGAKKIGEAPIIYKYQNNFSTDSAGQLNLIGIEWDSYQITAGAGYTIQKSEPPLPIDLLPGQSQTVNLFITSP